MESEHQHYVEVKTLFVNLNQKLVELLSSLNEDDWDRHTIARLWTVKDVAAHILDGNLKALSFQRDRNRRVDGPKGRAYKDVVKWLNNSNAEWVVTARRLSPQVIIFLLEQTALPVAEYFAGLNPNEKSLFPVDWAGEAESLNRLHVAREYSERWLHQQQIRDAVNKQGIMTRDFYYPFIDTLMHGLPNALKKADVADGTSIKVEVNTEAGGVWYATKEADAWSLHKNEVATRCEVLLDPDTAWKLFSKGITPATAKRKATISGDEKLADAALAMISVMA